LPGDGLAEPAEASVAAMANALMDLRADSIEATGDLEARTLEWARDRQEADTKLLDYRDRARELKSRIRLLEARGEESRCPTCGRPLGSEAGRLMATLSDEMEAVIQDGKWWKKRRAQLDEKPKELQAMEENSLRLHARVEEEAERVQRAREHHAAGREPLPREGPEGLGAAETTGGAALEALPGARAVLRRTANLLSSMTEGRISGVRVREGRLLAVGAGGREEVPEGTDLSAFRFAIRFSAWESGEGSAGEPGPLLLTELGGQGGEPLASAAIEVVAERLPEGGLALIVAPPSVAENLPECAARVLELTLDARGRWIVRRIPSGSPGISIPEEG
jgi:hypothetical protein